MLLGFNLLFDIKVDKVSEPESFKEYAARIKPLVIESVSYLHEK